MITEHKVHFQSGRRSRKKMIEGAKPAEPTARIPRIAKIMALAIHFDKLIREGKVKDQAELARLGHVSRARLSQIMLLLQLAPEIQEELVFTTAKDTMLERAVRKIALMLAWEWQRKEWKALLGGG